MLFAKTSKAAARLSEQIRNKEFTKIYLAVVDGKLEKTEGKFEDYLWKNEKLNKSFVVQNKVKKDAKLATLKYKVLKYDENLNLSVVEVELETGRHHQIRVQFATRNHALYADEKYGNRGVGHGKPVMLWAYRLSFAHPTTKEQLHFKLLPSLTGGWKILT
jgi:23S rRNA pseudouridine1911/1915/1917 synthase